MAEWLTAISAVIGAEFSVKAAPSITDWLTAIGTIVAAIGTILVCVLAIWGDWIKALFFHPRLRLVVPETPPSKITFDQGEEYYFHLQVVNKGNTIAKSCRVLLQDVYQGGAGLGDFDRQHVAVPLQFAWAPKEARPQQPNIPAHGHDTINLGVIAKGGASEFLPRFYWTPRGHEHSVPKGRKVRYFMSAVADNCASSETQIFEVSWDGVWDDDPGAMGNHLRVVEVQPRGAVSTNEAMFHVDHL